MNGKRVAVLILGGVVAAGGLAYALWPRHEAPAPPSPKVAEAAEPSPEQAAKYMASEAFAALDDAQKQEYFDRIVEKYRDRRDLFLVLRKVRDELTDEEQQRLRENTRPLAVKMLEREVDKFFALSPEEQTAYLDKRIDRMLEQRKAWEERRKQREKTAGKTAEPRRRRRRGPTLARIKERIESVPAEKRAKFIQYMWAFRKRVQERGIQGIPRRPRGP